MVEKLNVNLDFKKLGEIGQIGVRRAAAFVALGQKAWSDETIKSVKLDVPMGIQLLPDPLPDEMSKEVRSNYRVWLCGAAISEVMQALSLFVDDCYKIATYVSFENGVVTQDGLDRIERCRNDTNLASKLKRLEDECGVKSELSDHADSWARARNAHTHNHGFVRDRDCPPGSTNLTVTWRQFEISIDGKKIENIIGHQVEKDGKISFRLGNGSKQFAIGAAVDFTEQEILHICLTAHIHVTNTTKAVEAMAKSRIDGKKAS